MTTSPPLRFPALAIALLLAACAPVPKTPAPSGPAQATPETPVVRTPLPEKPAPSTAAAPRPAAPPAPVVLPADAIYVCVTESGGVRRQSVIEFAPRVYALCKRHPEMGPCQYERNVCRAGGGRVYAANGREITLATEAEYDRRVLRVRFRGD